MGSVETLIFEQATGFKSFRKSTLTLSDFKQRFLRKAGSAEAGFGVGHCEVGEFLSASS